MEKSYLRKVIESDSKESSKRFIAIWAMVIFSIVVIVSIFKLEDEGLITTMKILLAFVCTLLGITAWQATRTKNDTKKEENNEQI